MLWAPIVGGAMTLAGSYLASKSERPTIDPEMLKSLFGPGAVSADTMSFYKNLLNSPAFAEIMRSAGVQGTQLGNAINANVAAAGVPGSPLAAFSRAASRGYSGAIQSPLLADLFTKALSAAMSNNQMRAGIWGQSQLTRQETPSWERMLSASLLSGGAEGLSSWFTKKPAGGASTAGEGWA